MRAKGIEVVLIDDSGQVIGPVDAIPGKDQGATRASQDGRFLQVSRPVSELTGATKDETRPGRRSRPWDSLRWEPEELIELGGRAYLERQLAGLRIERPRGMRKLVRVGELFSFDATFLGRRL
jgi:hypothetical protein